MTLWQQICFLRLVFGWTYEKIGKYYNLTKQRVFDIFKKNVSRFDLDECFDVIKI